VVESAHDHFVITAAAREIARFAQSLTVRMERQAA
jgi:hypothetical protein